MKNGSGTGTGYRPAPRPGIPRPAFSSVLPRIGRSMQSGYRSQPLPRLRAGCPSVRPACLYTLIVVRAFSPKRITTTPPTTSPSPLNSAIPRRVEVPYGCRQYPAIAQVCLYHSCPGEFSAGRRWKSGSRLRAPCTRLRPFQSPSHRLPGCPVWMALRTCAKERL